MRADGSPATADVARQSVSRRTTGVRLLVVRRARPVREIRLRPRRWVRVGAVGALLLWGVPVATLAGIASQARDERAVLARDVELLTERAARLSDAVSGLERFAGVSAAPVDGAAPTTVGPAAAARAARDDSWFADLERRLEVVRGAVAARVRAIRSTPAGIPVAARLSSDFGWRANPFSGRGAQWHAGLDFPSPVGTPVRATADGVVEYVQRRGGYGLAVQLRHADGYTALFGHLSAATVRPGQRVARGDVVGRVGNEGRSTGPHVHYEVRRWGKPVDPRRVRPPTATAAPTTAPSTAPSATRPATASTTPPAAPSATPPVTTPF